MQLLNIKTLKMMPLLLCTLLLTACGFHLQNTSVALPPALHQLYIQTPDPYGALARALTQALRASGAIVVETPQQANTVLTIVSNNQSEQLLSVNGTQQTRQYILHLVVTYTINDAKGRELVGLQTATQDRPVTLQSDQIMGGNNEVNLFYQQMQRAIVIDIMSRLSSTDIHTLLASTPQP